MSSPTSPELNLGDAEGVQVLNSPNVTATSNEGTTPESESNFQTCFWSSTAVLAAATSSDFINPSTTYGKARVTVISSVANTYTVQVGSDGSNWYDLTVDNAGTIFTIACVAGHLNAARDLPGPLPAHIRLIAVGAATVSAGLELYGL